MRRLPILVLALLLGAPGVSRADEPRTGKRGDELEERIPAVSGHLFLKKGRHELAPTLGLTLADAFRQKLMPGMAYTWHFQEHWAATLRGGYTVARFTAPTVQVCPPNQGCAPPTEEQLDGLPGNLELVGSLAAEFSPVYGKINFIAEQVLHFDIFVTAGAAVAGYELTLPEGDGFRDASGYGPGVLLGIGQRFFLNEWFAVKLELLDLVYLQPNADSDNDLSNQLMFGAGISVFFPTSFVRERQG